MDFIKGDLGLSKNHNVFMYIYCVTLYFQSKDSARDTFPLTHFIFGKMFFFAMETLV